MESMVISGIPITVLSAGRGFSEAISLLVPDALLTYPAVTSALSRGRAAGVHGQTYVHRETIPLSLLREGLEKLKYDEVVKALEKVRFPLPGEVVS
jgi:hypothetical protein